MAESRRYPLNQPLDLDQILKEANHRWFRPNEILEILRNYQRFKLTPEAPDRPSAGSLFLFDRKALRYFRKDGHCWRKKKDGKTVREAHEKLKVGSVDVLHCYYAHGEDNDNFQRRCYWMLDGKLEHIVLVHYREVNEGYKSGVSHLLPDPGTQVENTEPNSVHSFMKTASPASTAQFSYTSSPNGIDWNGHAASSEYDGINSIDGLGDSSLIQPIHGSMSCNASQLAPEVEEFPVLSRNPPGSWFVGGKCDHGTGSSLWTEIHSSSISTYGVHNQKYHARHPSGGDLITHKLADGRLDGGSGVSDTVATGNGLIIGVDTQAVTAPPQRVIQEHDFNLITPQFHSPSGSQVAAASNNLVENKSHDTGPNYNESGELKKLDSFGRWMDKEIGRDCDDSLMASDSGNYWNTLGAENDDKEVSSLSHQMQLDVDLWGPSLSQEQLFSIHDFSPEWAYSGVETKVLIFGTFLGSKNDEIKWGCMFGEIEVSAEVLTNNVIRCQAPRHVNGRVPFYVTCRNRVACSEVREFEYRENPVAFSALSVKSIQKETCFQVRLARSLRLGPERKWLNCSIEGCNGCKLRNTLNALRHDSEKEWGKVRENCMVFEGNCMDPRDKLIQNLLKDRLCEWLVCKVHGGGKLDVLDVGGLGVIHLAAGLGYEWAMGLIVVASGNVNFRDARGKTALHWASYFGREETVIALVRLGVDPTAVDDPTPASPGGQTAADLASNQGHKGIAGYLAEAFLIKQLSSLSIKQNLTHDFTATIAAEKVIEIAAQVAVPSNREVDEQLSLKGSLAAVRKSAHAAALIQAAYKVDFPPQGQLPKSSDNISEVSLDLAALGSLNRVHKRNHYEDYLHSAAVKIQQKYRGWKGRSNFLKIRNRIVKIQAHVRGHQVRKQYKKVVWSVSIVEKAILRWRRKGTGLRGFQAEKAIGYMSPGTEKNDEYEFLRISRKQKSDGVEKALARVTSMVRHPEAREQYMRIVAKFENLKMADEVNKASVKGDNSQ